ncbi:MAG: ATP synthase subunit I [Lachnospiraceae bacterium]|nr:ATP synthase subunit I [Lachnospiraceae bacterium]
MLQPAVKKETRNVLVIVAIGTALMLAVFAILHAVMPDKVPLDYKVFLGGVCGAGIAFLNFFLMALTVQKIAAMEDRDQATKMMRLSYSRRLGIQCVWIVVAIFAPCFNAAAAIIPLFFPSLGIKIYGIFRKDLKTPPAPADGTDQTAGSAEEPGTASSDEAQ